MSFFSKKLSELSVDDLESLIAQQIRESIVLDYKSALYGKTDKEKKEFLLLNQFTRENIGELNTHILAD